LSTRLLLDVLPIAGTTTIFMRDTYHSFFHP